MLPPFIVRWLQPGWERLKVGEHSGIGLLDTSRAEHARQDFIARTTEALDLIRRVDPRRFERIRAHIKYIVHHELPYAWAQYDDDFQWCFVHFTQLDFSQDQGLPAAPKGRGAPWRSSFTSASGNAWPIAALFAGA